MIGLRQKLILSHVGLVALAMAIAGLYVFNQMEHFFLTSLMQNLQDRAVITASYLRSELSMQQMDVLQTELADHEHPHTTRTWVVDTQQRLVGSSEAEDAPLVGSMQHDPDLDRVLSGAETLWVGERHLPDGAQAVAFAPIKFEGHIIGAVWLSYRLSDLEAETAELSRNLGAGLLLAGVACTVFAALLAGTLAAPMQRLAAAARALARGDLSRRVSLRGRDEVAQAGDAFDSMADSLQSLELSRREVISEVSHDLHGLATGLSTAAEALQRGALDDPELAPLLLQGIAARTRQIPRLADDLLQTTRFETGRLVLERRAASPAELVEQTAAEFALQAAEHGVALLVQTESPQMLADIDAERLLQALANLVENALRHTPPGGSITLSARMTGDSLYLGVADTGAGMPSDEAARMFSRFYRPSGGRPGRLGLGLGIVRGIAEAHGGRVQVESGPGSGTTFNLILPVAPALSLEAAVPAPIGAHRGGAGSRE